MAYVSPALIRQRIATAISADADWAEVPLLFDLYETRNLDAITHQGFAIGYPATVVTGRRQRAMALCTTTLTVRWGYQIRHDAQVADGDAAVAAEIELVALVHGCDETDIGRPRLESIRRRSQLRGPVPLLITEATFSVDHFYPLE